MAAIAVILDFAPTQKLTLLWSDDLIISYVWIWNYVYYEQVTYARQNMTIWLELYDVNKKNMVAMLYNVLVPLDHKIMAIVNNKCRKIDFFSRLEYDRRNIINIDC